MPSALGRPRMTAPRRLAHLARPSPGAPVMPSACRVWIESITQTAGRSASSVGEDGLDRGLGQRPGPTSASPPEPLGAQPHLRRRLLAGDVEDARRPAARGCRAPSRSACSCRSRASRRAGRASRGPARRRARGRARRSRSPAGRPPAPRPRAAAPARGEPPSPGAARSAAPARAAGAALRLDQGVPLAAARAAARPRRRDVAALLADEVGAGGHRLSR